MLPAIKTSREAGCPRCFFARVRQYPDFLA
jgi:hypothetical protein